MKTLLKIRHSDVVTGAPDTDPSTFTLRSAARAIVTNAHGEVALLYAGKYKYHKLPGGGVEQGEDIVQALERELMEEIGCKARITGEVGRVVEYRDAWRMKQISDCFMAEQVGEACDPQFTDEELEEQFAVVWATDIEHAIQLLENDVPESYDGKYMQKRDLVLLRAAAGIE